jgi:hypothetical protein
VWAGVAALVVLALAGGGTAVAVSGLFDGASDGPGKPPQSAPASSFLPPEPSSSPLQPGVEPPKDGAWPAQWPKFAESDRVRTYDDLDGVGFPLKVPPAWQCILGGRARGFAKHFCGVSPGENPALGGEIIVRECPQPCDEPRQTTMRQNEEAWGLTWVRTGPLATYAESSSVQVDGAKRYGLVVVGFWRSRPGGPVDRQFVLRMTAPVDGAGQLRRVANHVRDTIAL